MALRQAHGISSYVIWLSAAYCYVFACSASDPQFIFLYQKISGSWSEVIFQMSLSPPPFQSMGSIAVCIMHEFQQPSVIGALCIYCLSESLPRTGSKILWRDFQLGKRKATWCSKSFKTLYPWTASATPHCRISQSFPRCTEWVVSFLSRLWRIDTGAENCLSAVAVFSLTACET